jgi:regulator of sigma D
LNKDKLQWWSGTLDFLSGGKFSIYNDDIKFRVWKNSMKILDESKQLIQKSGLDIKPIELKLQKEIIENISLEEDETLQKKWAALLANASTGRVSTNIVYAKILSELTSNEISILDLLRRIHLQDPYINTDYVLLHLKQFTKENIKESLDILFSKRLIESPKILGGDTIEVAHPIQSSTYEAFWYTPLGQNFVSACWFPDSKTQSHFMVGSLKEISKKFD